MSTVDAPTPLMTKVAFIISAIVSMYELWREIIEPIR